MADLAPTVANVIAASSARKKTGTAGATLAAFKAVYLDAATNKYKLADCDDALAAVRNVIGIALHASLDGQPVTIIQQGDLNVGAVLTAGVTYYLSPVAGGICPVADLTAGDYPIIIGVARSTSVLSVKITNTGAVLA